MNINTKQSIIDAFNKLILDDLLNKITVIAICDEAGVNRQTFYYYYKDIIDLMTSTVSDEIYAKIEGGRSYETWTYGFLMTMRYIKENKPKIKHIYYSTYWDEADLYFIRFNKKLLTHVVKECANNLDTNITDECINFIVHIYNMIFHGVFIEYMESDMKIEPEVVLSKLLKVISGEIPRAIIAFSGCK
ncbi:MAG: TetR/AcrR family transcriptional regulator C-terminal domain-containing protein [Peptostreptococcaceae bacterium]|nr:TetR/AcrR family transcriptional regulator C-terminal domain-containing protein [Peptostreptococcaceae bacterium]